MKKKGYIVKWKPTSYGNDERYTTFKTKKQAMVFMKRMKPKVSKRR